MLLIVSKVNKVALPEPKVVHNNTGNLHIAYRLPRRLYKRPGPKWSWRSSIRQETQNMQCVKPNNW